ncbi:MAG: hypothetical protein KGN84_01280 [Acidobacteriota bacterium]|nr:hypothetical protein [Acidobacteriota bacterium]
MERFEEILRGYAAGQMREQPRLAMAANGGDDPRDRQASMRHCRFTTAAEINEQALPEWQIRAVERIQHAGAVSANWNWTEMGNREIGRL